MASPCAPYSPPSAKWNDRQSTSRNRTSASSNGGRGPVSWPGSSTLPNHMAHTLSELFSEQMRLTTRLRREARIDPVTGLANRLEFDALVTSLLESEEGAGTCALILLQLRAFSAVNHSASRDRADELLRLVARRIENVRLPRGAIVQAGGGRLQRVPAWRDAGESPRRPADGLRRGCRTGCPRFGRGATRGSRGRGLRSRAICTGNAPHDRGPRPAHGTEHEHRRHAPVDRRRRHAPHRVDCHRPAMAGAPRNHTRDPLDHAVPSADPRSGRRRPARARDARTYSGRRQLPHSRRILPPSPLPNGSTLRPNSTS